MRGRLVPACLTLFYCTVVSLVGCRPSDSARERPVTQPGPHSSRGHSIESATDDYRTVPTEFAVPHDGRGMYEMHSSVREIYFTAIDRLPHVVEPRSRLRGCAMEQPRTAGGKAALAAGWKVSGEQRLGKLTAVAIFRGLRDAPGSHCYELDAVVVLFERERPIAVLRRADPLGEGIGVGSVARVKPGVIEIGQSVMSAPLGRLSLEGQRLRFDALPLIERHCGGRVTMPNLYTMQFWKMRDTVLQAGWRPRATKARHRDVDDEESMTAFQRQRFSETEECGPMMGCNYRYRRGGDTLFVGLRDDEDPNIGPGDDDNRHPRAEDDYYLAQVVTSYRVLCRGDRSHQEQ